MQVWRHIYSLNWTFIINIDISIYKDKDVYVDIDKDTDSDLYDFQNPYDYKICFSMHLVNSIFRKQSRPKK